MAYPSGQKVGLKVNGEEVVDLVIPAGVTSISNNAFIPCKTLVSVTIPEGVTSIGEWTFAGCDALKKAKLPSSLTSLGDYAFGYITLDEVTVEATTPPTLLNTWSISGTTLYVPAGSKAAYEADENWKSSFKEIAEMAQVTKFAVEQGKTYTSGQRFDFDNISLTIGEAGGADFDRYVDDGCYVDNNVNGNNAGGSFYVFEPKEDGTLAVDVRLNNWKPLQVLEDGKPLEGISGKAFADIFMGNISFPVKAGKTYKVYADGSKLGLGGFTFPGETAELPASLINEEQKFTTDGISYVISSVAKATVDVIGSSNGGEVEIPKTVRMYSEDGSRNFKFNVTGMVEGAFADNRELTSIIIPNTIQFIGAGAFSGYSQLSVVTMRTAEPLNIPDDVFSNRADVLLLVPGASMDAYKAAGVWKEFKKTLPTGTAYFVVEKGATYQSGQRIETDKIVLTMGEEGGLAFDIYESGYVRNQTDGSSEGGSFYVFEPKTDGKYNCVLSDRHNGHTATVKYLAESNTYRVVVASFASKELTGSDGVVCTLTLQASADMAKGSYTAGIQSGKYSLTSGAASVVLLRAEVALTVGNEMKGDVNGDGSVNTKDIVSVVGYIMGNTPDGFNAAAADVNGDGVVNIADVVALVNIVAGK